tara:strand:+ start:312 stop:857 length:546 start_codon:yes stop_codon:yes gene_type:complete
MLSDDYTIKELGNIDITPILEEFNRLPDEVWELNTERQETKNTAQNETKFVPIVYYGKNWFKEELHYSIYHAQSAIEKVLGKIHIGRAIFTCLPAGKVIYPHKDSGAFLESNTRIHIPLISNNKVSFGVYENNEWNFMYLEPGKFYALNNCNTRHRVENNSNLDRYHLIIDVKDIEKVPLI